MIFHPEDPEFVKVAMMLGVAGLALIFGGFLLEVGRAVRVAELVFVGGVGLIFLGLIILLFGMVLRYR